MKITVPDEIPKADQSIVRQETYVHKAWPAGTPVSHISHSESGMAGVFPCVVIGHSMTISEDGIEVNYCLAAQDGPGEFSILPSVPSGLVMRKISDAMRIVSEYNTEFMKRKNDPNKE